ncbi:polymerase delta-interacting protein 2-like isoform X2 [Clytia hemisphaerica]|uniref:ApaG domain-containing protein n=1 Tax=Clytia hemisphaerica TaxID=252671 RepID=A0A7M5XCC2_9CNID
MNLTIAWWTGKRIGVLLARPSVLSMKNQYVCKRNQSTMLAEVGRFETPKVQGKYEAGQLFLHRVFGYRGVILYPWIAKFYDLDSITDGKDKPILEETPQNEKKNTKETAMKPSSSTYYQVLIDERDYPHIRAQSEAVTFLGNPEDTTLYAVPGLDYVNHTDILPYISSSEQPIEHDLFKKFLLPNQDQVPAFTASPSLRTWHQKNHKWLELSEVIRETTDNIRVTAIPFYMGSRMVHGAKSYWWRYSIRLENMGMESVQLKERHWRIFCLSGVLDSVKGRGVVGQEPVLSTRQPAFQYSSHVTLPSPSGHMWGTYRLERPDGRVFDVRIPSFPLESKEDDPITT